MKTAKLNNRQIMQTFATELTALQPERIQANAQYIRAGLRLRANKELRPGNFGRWLKAHTGSAATTPIEQQQMARAEEFLFSVHGSRWLRLAPLTILYSLIHDEDLQRDILSFAAAELNQTLQSCHYYAYLDLCREEQQQARN